MLRAVLDTNVVVAGKRSRAATSPNAEIIERWGRNEFEWLVTDDILEEYLEKLLEHGIDPGEVRQFIFEVLSLGERVTIGFFHLRHYPSDPDDTAFLLAALNGSATHLVTYDDDLVNVAVFYPEFFTCRPLEFLVALRAAPARPAFGRGVDGST